MSTKICFEDFLKKQNPDYRKEQTKFVKTEYEPFGEVMRDRGIKKPSYQMARGFLKVASTYSPTLKRAVPSAQVGLTSLFGMGRGGPYCYKHLKSLRHISV